MRKILFLLCIIYAVQLNGTIHNVPGDYSTIGDAIDASVDGDTVLVEPNTYFENINYYGKNIVVGSLFLTTNDTSMISKTIIDGSANGSVVTIDKNEDSTAVLIGFTIRNGKTTYGGGIYIKNASPFISNCIIRNNLIESANPIGGGIFLNNSKSTIYGCEIMYNTATGQDYYNGWGGGIAAVSNSTVRIINCKIHHNKSTSLYGGIGLAESKVKVICCEITNNFCYGDGSGIGFQDSDLLLVNCTIARNKSTLGERSSLYFIRSSPVIYNCVFWYNSGSKNINGWGGTPEIHYSNIQGGFDTLSVMDSEPMFADTSAGDFRLQAFSPCIDAGDPDTSGLTLPMYDFYGNLRLLDGDKDGISIIDMGAYEYAPQPVSVEDKMVFNGPNSFYLKQNYPNPFNSSTLISYYLPEATDVNITIYNILGKKINTLINCKQLKGNHSVTWTGTDDLNRKVVSGIYFYQLKTGKNILNKKMILSE